jgi:hypothetical protein
LCVFADGDHFDLGETRNAVENVNASDLDELFIPDENVTVFTATDNTFAFLSGGDSRAGCGVGFHDVGDGSTRPTEEITVEHGCDAISI